MVGLREASGSLIRCHTATGKPRLSYAGCTMMASPPRLCWMAQWTAPTSWPIPPNLSLPCVWKGDARSIGVRASGERCGTRGLFRLSSCEFDRGRCRAFSGLSVRAFRGRGPVPRAAGSPRGDVRHNRGCGARRALRRQGHVRRCARAVK
jgi:hypothetical protein